MALSLSKGNMECLSAEAVRKTLAKANGISLVFLTAGGGGVKKGRNQESGIRNQESGIRTQNKNFQETPLVHLEVHIKTD
jgi:hypothetical protein